MRTRTRDLPACTIVFQPTTFPRAPFCCLDFHLYKSCVVMSYKAEGKHKLYDEEDKLSNSSFCSNFQPPLTFRLLDLSFPSFELFSKFATVSLFQPKNWKMNEEVFMWFPTILPCFNVSGLYFFQKNSRYLWYLIFNYLFIWLRNSTAFRKPNDHKALEELNFWKLSP